MRLMLKSLTGKFSSVEVNEDDTVAALKQRIHSKLGIPVDQQNLVFVGKVLTDQQNLVREVGLCENSVVVIFVKKSKAPLPPALKPEDLPPPPTQNTNTNLPQMQPICEEKLDFVTSMGFDEELATKALRASSGDVTVAVTFCMSGIIPDSLDLGTGHDKDIIPSNVRNIFNQLREHPQFSQLRALVNYAPNSLQIVAQQLSACNPALEQAITQYPDEFKFVLTNVSEKYVKEGGNPFHFGTGGVYGGGGIGRGQQPTLSAEDNANIQQIMDMTQASRNSAMEAYIVSNRNAEQAINFLFDS